MKRTLSHWSLRYLINRSFEKIYRLTHPRLPWLTPQANRYLQAHIKPSFTGLEFGSGRSTIWLAKHLEHLTSFEHNPVWYEKVKSWLADASLTNVDYFLKHREQDKEPDGIGSDYINSIDHLPDNSFDFILVDGVYRAECANRVLPKLKPGGLLAIDNTNLYLPCQSFSPHSRTIKSGPASPRWAEFLQSVQGWETIWTSNGVSDTAFFFKPR
jgi:predicted O-methyltransferase YrrM